MVIGILLMVFGISTCLTGCQGAPPPGYNCKTDNAWGNGAGSSGFHSGPYSTVLDRPSGTTVQSPSSNAGTTLGGAQDGAVSGSADSYMLTWSNSRYYTAEELSSLSKWELQVARNEIYARHGVRFGTGPIQDHFLTRSWYHPTVDMSQFNASVLNDYETANINMIQSVEATK